MTRAEVIIPVRNGADLIDECLDALLAQVPIDAVCIVDDASTDDTVARVRRRGVRVLQLETAGGPYAARNVGWQQSDADVVVFTDVRCRALPGWYESLLRALTKEGVVIAGCDVRMRAVRPTTAQRWAIRHQPLQVRGYLEHHFMPYVPTACLAIRHDDLVTLGGFRAVRSGADADLCWRAQLAGLGTIAASEVGMYSSPRDSARAVLTQFRRYGASGRELQRIYSEVGHIPKPPRRIGTARRALRALLHGWSDPAVGLLDAARMVVYENSFRAALRREGDEGQRADG